jgi:formate--tetrahydrofolate ligase
VVTRLCEHWAHGGAGAEQLAEAVIQATETGSGGLQLSYPDEMLLLDKIRRVAQNIYGALDVVTERKSRRHLQALEAGGYGHLPVCMAKTPYSFTADPARKGAPQGFELPIREVRLSAGAGFVVVLCGDLYTMPGLPRRPSAGRISVDDEGLIEGLF